MTPVEFIALLAGHIPSPYECITLYTASIVARIEVKRRGKILVMQKLVRQAKLGASCKVQVLTRQGLTNHLYRVLQVSRNRIGNTEKVEYRYGRTKYLKRTQGIL